MVITSILLLVVVLGGGCSAQESTKELMTTAWYMEGASSPTLILYEDGTCMIEGEYGVGSWSLADDNQLRLTNYYGETAALTVVSIEDGCLTLGDGGENTVQLWNEAQ